ncbi:thiolase family protein [Pseudofulvimonas gallinarii]|jgi:acetyl-CoA C-acetyltransferase|uniref:Acetyl-CoA C-acetyltransferase n=1 Tax=Pseudofulvimonas gallinarii TaxID=634155 RepID=A0A4S3KW18_9GAMM|nr:acetyl-CoA C-acyltransferase [Pseudofulvimonas gallinarii]TCS97543.1 acetyl-CoA C-acetyltransferase [Pseudofulvimonas gallinarii]THD13475.1 acetyl-CoA acetyltransferase [Pseudofulvimonas gallinarii]
MTEIYIAGAKRTAIGSFQGQFDGVPATHLGSTAIRAALDHAGLPAEAVEEVFMGCVLPANLGQAPARQAALDAGIPRSAGCTTVNKVCGSGMKSIMLAHDAIKAGSIDTAIAGGMESMTNAPYMLPKARGGYRMGNGEIVDHMMWDGLTNPYDKQAMGVFGEMCVNQFAMTREDQDAFAAESVRRALAATESGAFDDEIAAVTVTTRKGEVTVTRDEEPPRCDIEKIPTLRPAFKRDGGTITAASSSKISDGAAAVVVVSAEAAQQHRLTPLARIVAHATHAQAPEWFTTAPVFAIQKVLEKAGWGKHEVDLYEINEAFACVAMAPIRELGIDHAKVNVHGGACALGHPIGASGARIVVTLIHALRARGAKRGIASLCIGGGEATAIAIELV